MGKNTSTPPGRHHLKHASTKLLLLGNISYCNLDNISKVKPYMQLRRILGILQQAIRLQRTVWKENLVGQIAIYLEELGRFPPMEEENAKNIEKFADLLDISVINLKEADHEEDLGNGSLYHTLQRKMPETMLTRYHRWVYENGEEETVETLKNWVNQESVYYTIASETIHGLVDKSKSRSSSNKNRTFVTDSKKKDYQRKVCGESHQVWECDQFKGLKVRDRWTKAKLLKLCFQCLRDNHCGNECRKSRQCGINGCLKTHYRLLHETQFNNRKSELNENAPEFVPETRQETINQVFVSSCKSDIIALRTVPVIIAANEKKLKVNALLDDGSTKTYLNQDVACELGINSQPQEVSVNVMNRRKETFQTMTVTFEIQNANSPNLKTQVEAFTTTNVTGSLAPIDWKKQHIHWNHLKGIDFPQLANTNKIDLLIGLDYSDFHRSIEEIHGKPEEPVDRLTPLGWTCVGTVSLSNEHRTLSTLFINSNDNLDKTLRQFWETESFEENGPSLSLVERKTVNITEQTLVEEENLYKVSVPWKENKTSLSNNYSMAYERLKRTEKKLEKEPAVKKSYSDIIEKYTEKGYVKKLQENSVDQSPAWYLPHFAVIRSDKETTKVRIVFDASAKFKGVSLNDVIYQGPKLQRELFDVLLRFRKSSVAVACDVAEMYLQVGLNEKDQPYHRFLWRQSPDDSPQVYEFNRLVFGVNVSSFLAQFLSQFNAKKYQSVFPLAAETVLKSTYIDDELDSVETVKQGIVLYHQLNELWKKAGMHVRIWVCNSIEVLEEVPVNDRASQVDLSRRELPLLKTLGVLWNATDDNFSFQYIAPDKNINITKRKFLSAIATVFDPLGLLAPFIMTAKILMQEIWVSGIEWDDEVYPETAVQIKSWFMDMDNLKYIQVPRCIQLDTDNEIYRTLDIHTFVDASAVAYGAVVYLKCSSEQKKVSVVMVAAKGRVAPLQAVSTPRLELMGAFIGFRLTKVVCQALGLSNEKATLWSDSTNVLFWLRNHSRHLKPFVANRVSEIQSLTNPSQWRYVPSEINPADIISRGMTASELVAKNLWWHGPDFLKREKSEWPENKVGCSNEPFTEVKKSKQTDCFVSVGHNLDSSWKLHPERFSKWTRLVHILAWVYRFINNCSDREKASGSLTAQEIRDGEHKLISNAQYEQFKTEIHALKTKSELPDKSKLGHLNL